MPNANLAETYLAASLATAAADRSAVPILTFYLDHGYAIALTSTDGNCAPDTVAVHSGSPRTIQSWQQTRQLVYGALCSLSLCTWFQEAFVACQEFDEPGSELAGDRANASQVRSASAAELPCFAKTTGAKRERERSSTKKRSRMSAVAN